MITPVKVLGIDPSLTCTSLVLTVRFGEHDLCGVEKHECELAERVAKSLDPLVQHHVDRIVGGDLRGVERLDRFDTELESYLGDVGEVDLAVIEGYAYGAEMKREVLGELGGVIRMALWRNRVPYMIVAVPTLKKFTMGRGNTPKSMMIKEVYKRWGFEAGDDNDADAYALSMLGQEWLRPNRTKKLEEMLKKVERVARRGS